MYIAGPGIWVVRPVRAEAEDAPSSLTLNWVGGNKGLLDLGLAVAARGY